MMGISMKALKTKHDEKAFTRMEWGKSPRVRPWCLDCLSGLDWITRQENLKGKAVLCGETIHHYVTAYSQWWGVLQKAFTAYDLLANQSVISSRNYCRNEYTASQLELWHTKYLSTHQG